MNTKNYLYTPNHNFNYVDFNVDENGKCIVIKFNNIFDEHTLIDMWMIFINRPMGNIWITIEQYSSSKNGREQYEYPVCMEY